MCVWCCILGVVLGGSPLRSGAGRPGRRRSRRPGAPRSVGACIQRCAPFLGLSCFRVRAFRVRAYTMLMLDDGELMKFVGAVILVWIMFWIASRVEL